MLAATHRDLEAEVAAGRFREDLYYRLKVVTLEIAPLRDRLDDIPVLATAFLQASADRMGVPAVRPSAALLDLLKQRRWPGNVRELANELESLVALSENGELDLSQLSPSSRTAPAVVPPAVVPGTGALREQMDAFEKRLLDEALTAASGNRTDAARSLGIGRATLHDKLRKHGLG